MLVARGHGTNPRGRAKVLFPVSLVSSFLTAASLLGCLYGTLLSQSVPRDWPQAYYLVTAQDNSLY